MCATLGLVPVIRASKDNAAEQIAIRLDQKLRDNLRDARNNLFAFESVRAGQLSSSRPVLIIADRSADLATMLHHTWTDQALVHDVLGLDQNRVSMPDKGKKVDYDLHCGHDRLWTQHKGNAFPLVAEAIQGDLRFVSSCENREADFHRKYFRKIIYDDVSQIDLPFGEIVAQHRGNYAKLLKFPDEMQKPSHNLRLSKDERRFEKMLIADSNYQAKLFQLIFEVLIDTAKVPKVPKSSLNLNSETHFSYGCWDLFELLKERDKSLVKFIEFGYLIEFEFDCFMIRTNSGPKPCTFLAGDHTGSLVKYEENGDKVLVYLEGGITNARIVSQANPQPRARTGCEELQELVANGVKQLHAATIFYHRSLNKKFKFQINDYMFRLKWPPSHTHNCLNSQPIQTAGFPKEIDFSERIGICSCIQGCADSESLIEVYTKICKLFFFVKRKGAEVLKTPYEGRLLKIRFDEIRQHHDWHFHWHGTEKRLILDHPESYDQSRIESMSIDCDYGFGCLPVSTNQLENQRKTLGVHELFNVNQHPRENIFFRFGPN
ncbi:unnamed protein product, partial [Mesorhabditis belari]|uniref:Uncharacterized protein n=1 Tax=Mesorhabditis belari TaxID=2138241 RepID=A0AAF3FDQ9_9BILA